MKIIKIIFPVFLVMFMGACSETTDSVVEDTLGTAVSPIVVTVNGSPITEAEVELAIYRTLGENAELYINQEIEEKLIKSLVSSRAIAQKAESNMDDEELEVLRLKAAAYREELLVKAYLKKHITPKPVTTEMVKKYYLDNTEKFGGEAVKSFEYIQINIQKESDPSVVVRPLNNIKKSEGWKQAAKELEQANPAWQVNYKKAELKISLVRDPLKSLVKNHTVGEVAPLRFEDGVYTLLRIIDERVHPAKPLAEVSAKIRKLLAPLQIKQSVKEITNFALKDAQVEYQ